MVCGGLREPQQDPVPHPDLQELVLQEHRQLQSWEQQACPEDLWLLWKEIRTKAVW